MSESHRSQRSVVAVVLAALVAGAPAVSTASVSSQRAPLTSREKALHVLNRLAFGPRPGDVDRVLEMGVGAWIEQQLNPEAIPDAAATARLKELPTLSMSQGEIFDTFEKPVREARRQRKAAAGTANEKMTLADAAKADAAAQEDIRSRIPPEKRPRRVIEELAAARLIRAAVSDRQLNEVLVDFWMNHFNVYAAKGLDRIFVTSFERDVVRPRIWGRFEDLLMATAKSPAMLFYLDNAQSVADPEHRPAPPLRRFSRFGGFGATMEMEARAANRKGGLNENYARELMELHTLGVDGGYTQKDVTELARVLTGWSINPAEGSFVFRARVHDAGAKTVLGRRFGPGGGIEEGEQMISALARNRSTARHIAFQLCQRLVADAPPADLVDRVAKKFLSTDGDLRETVRAVVASPEFFSPETYRAKVKSPFEYVASAIRAGGGETNARLPVVKEIAQMGEPLYLCQPPTGYSDAASAWVNAGALVARLNFAIALASNKLPGTEMDLGKLVSPQDAADPKRSVDALARVFLGGELTPETRQTIESQLENRVASPDDPSANTQLPLIAGLILGSPEFQRQ
jgi:uncharacterized protein (DUF1800 family)